MATFQAKVQSYIGTFTDTDALTSWLTQAAKTIVDLLPLDKALKYTVDITDSGSGVSITGHRLLRAHKSGYEAVPIGAGLSARAKDTESIYYASTKSPVYYVENGKVFILPSGGTGIGVAYPSVLYSAESITNFPQELEQAVILYTAIQARIKQLSDKTASLASLSYSAKTPPSAPVAPDFSYVDATVASIAATTIGAFSTVPAYSATIPSAPTFTITAVPPTPPDAPAISYADATVSSITDTFTLSLTSHYTELETALMTDVDIEKAQSKINDILARIQDFSTASELALKKAMENAKNTTDLNLQNKLQSLQASVQNYRAKLDLYAAGLDKYKSDISIKVSEGQLNLGSYEAEARTNLLDGLNKFNADNAEYQASIQKVLEQARLDQQRLIEVAQQTTNLNLQNKAQKLASDIQLYSKKLELYQGEITSYAAEVQEGLGEFQNKITKTVQEHETMRTQLEALKNEFNLIMGTLK